VARAVAAAFSVDQPKLSAASVAPADSRAVPVTWITVDADKAVGRLTEIPTRDTIPLAAQEQLIVELYSK